MTTVAEPAGVSAFSGTSVLVTGGAGFIGRHLVQRLIGHGADVTVSTSRPAADVSVPGARVAYVDLGDDRAVLGLMEQVAPIYTFHLAGEVTRDTARSLVRPTLVANLVSTVNLLDAAATVGAVQRFVHAGSLEVPAGDDAPTSPYAAAKAAAAQYVRFYDHCYGVPANVARLFMVYGPGAQPDTRLVPYVLGCLSRGESPQLANPGRMVDWVFVDDAVEGLIRLATTDDLEGHTVDIGTGQLTSVLDVANKLALLTNAGVVVQRGPQDPTAPAPPHQVECRADIEATARRLGWFPSTSLDDGLAATVAGHRGPTP